MSHCLMCHGSRITSDGERCWACEERGMERERDEWRARAEKSEADNTSLRYQLSRAEDRYGSAYGDMRDAQAEATAAENERDALREELAGVRGGAVSGWVHAEDRNPASGGCYIAQDDDGEVLPAWWNGRRWEDSCGAMIFPLRWQPLPVPPKDKPPASAGDGRGGGE